MLYCDEVWTGLEYHIAGHMLQEGMVEPAFHLIKAARDRHDGTYRNPFNEIECGDHYARPMVSWVLLEGAGGRTYDGLTGTLGFDPRVTPEDFRSFFITAAGWGSFAQRRDSNRQTNSLRLAYGELALRELRLGLPEGIEPASVKVGGNDAGWRIEGGQLTLDLGETTLGEGDELIVETIW